MAAYIMLVSAFVNKTIRKAGRPFCLAMGFVTMLLGALLLNKSLQRRRHTRLLLIRLQRIAGGRPDGEGQAGHRDRHRNHVRRWQRNQR
jgi:hypothetical protein